MDKILIIDFGSQVTQLIARRIREFNVYCEIKPYTIKLSEIKEFAPKGIILSGGPASVLEKNSPTISADIFKLGLPIFGICYGQQLMTKLLGGKVVSSNHREFGKAFIKVESACDIFKNLWQGSKKHQVWMSHGDRVEGLPKGFKVVAKSEGAPCAFIADEKRKFYGVQFHPEVVHTPDGAKLLENFVLKVCKTKATWNMGNFLEVAKEKIRKTVGKENVICAVSGGVDSTVVATLINEAIGKQLTCIFVDTGLLRKNEAKQVMEMFEKYHVNLKLVDASKIFPGKLVGVTDPEQKRKIIGKTFIDVFDAEAKKVEKATKKAPKFLAQGTLYPDVIESVSVHGDAAVTIKSHHNVGGLPAKMKMKVLEPVRELFKDEVRKLGQELGLSKQMVSRHPFPGPGLAIRIPGEITPEKIKILQEADAIYIEEIRKAKLYDKIWQAFVVLLPVKTVGVMGDGRTYEYVCAIRAVTSTDGMTADYYPFKHEFLSNISNKIVNNVKGINRVVYDISSKPPGTIEWE